MVTCQTCGAQRPREVMRAGVDRLVRVPATPWVPSGVTTVHDPDAWECRDEAACEAVFATRARGVEMTEPLPW